MRFNFISGLPRAGSTLLASILNQNSAFRTSIMSPVGRVVGDALQGMTKAEGSMTYMSNLQRKQMLQGLFEGYYRSVATDVVTTVFDTNRRWCCNLPLLYELYPTACVIVCLREPAAIVDSFEQLFQQNPLNLSNVIDNQANTTVYSRTAHILSDGGVLGFALNAVSEAWFSPLRSMLLPVVYDDLARWPDKIMTELHEAMGEPEFKYDFENIQPVPGVEEFDRSINTPGLHTLRKRVTYEPRQSVLPPDLWKALPVSFWNVNNLETKVT